MRVAAVDCGTNSVRLLVADGAQGRLSDLHREMRIVRLGQGVDRTGRLAAAAIERTRVALADYAAIIASLGVDRVRLVATSATRDAANRAEFEQMVHATLHTDAQVVTGVREAELTFAGAVNGLDASAGPVLVADIGGGSTELVRAGGGEALRAVSLDVGAVRMTERYLHDDPPTPSQVAAAAADVRTALDAARHQIPLDRKASLVGVAGTITTVAALALGLEEYQPELVHGSVLTAESVAQISARLLGMSHHQRAALGAIHPGRVDVICGGAVILRTLLEQLEAGQLTVSEHDILDGIALSLLA